MSKKPNFEIIVIDNNSKDKNLLKSELEKDFPEVRILFNKSNVGFAAANNLGIKIAQGDIFLFLNPDTLIIDDAIAKLFELIKTDKSIGAVGPLIYDSEGNIQFYCGRTFPNPLTEIFKHSGIAMMLPKSKLFGGYLMTYWDHKTTREVDLIQGSCMMTSRAVVEKVGKMDTQFFLFGDDVEWCYRIKKAKFKIFMYAPAKIIHIGGKSVKGRESTTYIIGFDSMYKFFKIHYCEIAGSLYRISVFLMFSLKMIVASLFKPRLHFIYLKVAMWALGMLKVDRANLIFSYKGKF